MRFAWTIDTAAPAAEVAATVATLERWGYDAVWIDDGTANAAAVAASLAAATTSIRFIVGYDVGSIHPVTIAEEVAVADLSSGGRLTLVLKSGDAESDLVGETADLVLDAFGTHPFRHAGKAWPTPANLPENKFNLEDKIRVTPAPAQIDLGVWMSGAAARSDATSRALGVVVDAEVEDLATVAEWWTSTRQASPWLRGRIRRALLWTPPTVGDQLDIDGAVEALREWQRALDVDLVAVRPPSRFDDSLMVDLAVEVRPRVQLDRLPPGLEDHWTEQRAREAGS